MTVTRNAINEKDQETTTRAINFNAPVDLSRRVRLTAAERDVSQQELWLTAMRRYLRHLSNKQRLSVVDRTAVK